MTSQFALRVAILGGVALAMFSIIFLRLWYLQVLSGSKYTEEAQNNRIREIKVTAPRGNIEDRNGKVLVDNRTALALQVAPERLPNGHRALEQEFQSLSHVTGLKVSQIQHKIEVQTAETPASPATLRQDVQYPVVYYLQEHQSDFPGVTVERVYVRNYPLGDLGAHLFGYVREVSGDQLKESRYSNLQPGDTVGQAGVEYTYDHLLRGQDGATRIQVDASGRPKGEPLTSRQPQAGNNLIMTVDENVQAAGESALSSYGLPGAFVAMDVHSGAILGMASYPTFDPSIYTHPLSPQTYNSLTSEANNSPQTDRAIQGLYPTGSTFKLITATAGLEDGLVTPNEVINDGGSLTVGDITFHNSGNVAHGPVTMTQALQVSSDVYFYTLGVRAENSFERNGSEPIQQWAERYGLGSPTGIDLPSEFGGLVPSPEWRNQLYADAQKPNSPGGTNIVPFKETDRPWSAGDMVNLSVGQGDVQITPLQLAVAYATLGNGGTVVRPHVGMRVEDPTGRIIEEINPPPRRQIDINPAYRRVILDGLHAAAMEPGGTSYPVFGGFPIQIAGKTGTAQHTGQADQSWYAALAPYPNPQVVVVATIEQGGFGVDSAAPVVSQILQSIPELGVNSSKIRAAGSTAGAYE
jgi:penicillin-binding protein 2